VKSVFKFHLKNNVAWVVIIGALLIYWLLSRNSSGPAFLSEEIGYLANATFLAGHQLYGSSEGFLTYGPYLELTAGKYIFQIDYSAQQGSQSEIGRWDVLAWVDGKAETLSEGSMSPGTDQISGGFEIKDSPAVIEVRTYFKGSGVLVVESITIKVDNN
jgi:hypothetical protein